LASQELEKPLIEKVTYQKDKVHIVIIFGLLGWFGRPK